MTDTQEKRRYIQGGPERRGRSGHVTRARFYKWVIGPMRVPIWLFDHTQIYRVGNRTVIETEPYCNLPEQSILALFAEFTKLGWEVRVSGAPQRPAPAVNIKLTSPDGWKLNAAEVPVIYGSGRHAPMGGIGPDLCKFLP